VANLLHDVYVDRRHQYAILMGLGCSPALSLLRALAFGLILALSGSLTGWLLAVVFGPRDFAMPSLMSDLGSVVPRFDAFVVGASLAVAITAISLGLASTIRQLPRHPGGINAGR
jgi:hypothetical protein